MLQQLDENNREIEQQRSEIRRLRQQVQMLVQSGSDTSVLLHTTQVPTTVFTKLCPCSYTRMPQGTRLGAITPGMGGISSTASTPGLGAQGVNSKVLPSACRISTYSCRVLTRCSRRLPSIPQSASGRAWHLRRRILTKLSPFAFSQTRLQVSTVFAINQPVKGAYCSCRMV